MRTAIVAAMHEELAAVLADIQKIVDTLNLKAYANLDAWVRQLDADVEARLVRRLERAVLHWAVALASYGVDKDEAWQASSTGLTTEDLDPADLPHIEPFAHEILVRNQVMFLSPPPERARENLLAQLQQRLAALRRLPFGDALAPVLRVLRPGFVDLVEGLAFEHPEAPLAQTGVRHHVHAGRLGDRPRGFVGAREVAGIDRGQGLPAEGVAHAAGLPTPGLVQLDVELPLDARVHVPGRLAMPRGDDARGFHAAPL